MTELAADLSKALAEHKGQLSKATEARMEAEQERDAQAAEVKRLQALIEELGVSLDHTKTADWKSQEVANILVTISDL